MPDKERLPTKAEEEKSHAEAQAALALTEKYKAEAENFRAETNRLGIEIGSAKEQAKAEITSLAIELDTARLGARTQAATTAMVELELKQRNHTEDVRMSSDIYQHRFTFDQPVNMVTVDNALDILKYWESHDEKPGDIEFVIVSPGGDVVAGMYLFDYLQGMKRNGWIVTTVTYGMAYSMGGILLQAASPGKRTMSAEAMLLIHEVSSWGLGGKTGEVEDDMERMKKWQDRIVDIFISRAGGKITATEFKRRWKRKDWWIMSDEALALGLVDVVR